jgi:hypothetical protein
MATATLPAPPAQAVYIPQALDLYRFTVAQYQQMVEAGVLGPDDHVELLEGWVVNKMSRNPPHDGTLGLILPLLMACLPAGLVLRVQAALVLARSIPEPDFAIVQGPAEIYLKRHPRPADTVLLIEVADSSRMTDRRIKGGWYAEAKIPEFWLVNLVDGLVEVYTQPRAGKSPVYRNRHDYRPGEQVPLVLNGQEVARLEVTALCPVKA